LPGGGELHPRGVSRLSHQSSIFGDVARDPQQRFRAVRRQQCRERGRGQDVGRGRSSRGQPCCSAPCGNFSRSGAVASRSVTRSPRRRGRAASVGLRCRALTMANQREVEVSRLLDERGLSSFQIKLLSARGEVFDPRRLLEKIEVMGPPIELSALRSNICAEVVDRVGVSWDEMFGRLLLFRNTHEHCRVPTTYKDKKLANWVGNQRALAIKGLLSALGSSDWMPSVSSGTLLKRTGRKVSAI
jgi:helicase associated protein